MVPRYFIPGVTLSRRYFIPANISQRYFNPKWPLYPIATLSRIMYFIPVVTLSRGYFIPSFEFLTRSDTLSQFHLVSGYSIPHN